MMRAQADPKATSNLLYGLACVLLAGSVAGLLWRKPSASAVQAKAKIDAAKYRTSERESTLRAEEAKRSVMAQTWTESAADITPQIWTLSNALAKKNGVKVVRLQPPAKATEGESLEAYPYTLVVEGSFKAVTDLERDLEAPQNRLAVNSFQATSSNTETDVVSASIGLVAHRIPAEASVEKEKTNAKRK